MKIRMVIVTLACFMITGCAMTKPSGRTSHEFMEEYATVLASYIFNGEYAEVHIEDDNSYICAEKVDAQNHEHVVLTNSLFTVLIRYDDGETPSKIFDQMRLGFMLVVEQDVRDVKPEQTLKRIINKETLDEKDMMLMRMLMTSWRKLLIAGRGISHYPKPGSERKDKNSVI